MTILSDGFPKARKRHTCDAYPFQGHDIEPGEVYHSQSLIGDDGPYTFKTCAYHAAIMETMWRLFDYWPEGINGDDVCEQLYEWWGDAERSVDRGIPYPVPFDSVPKRWKEVVAA